MKTLLIFPQTKTHYGLPNYPPLGLAYLAGMLKKENKDYDVLDLRLYSDWKNILIKKLKENYELVGITCTTFDFNSSKELARIIKENSKSKVILGGPHPTLIRKEILNNKDFDFGIIGEGEYTIIELLNALESKSLLKQINGLVYRKDGSLIENNPRPLIENLDSLPFPEYEKFDLKRYHGDTSMMGIIKRRTIMPLLSSRGCPFGCIYCSIGLIMGKKFRARSPENIIAEIKHLKQKYNAGIIDFLDDNFTLDINRSKEICKLMIKENIKIKWGLPNGIRVDKLDDELVLLMKKAGCHEISLGIESVDNEILKELKKGTTLETIENAIKILRKNKIPIRAFFLIGSPKGTKQEVLNALTFAINNNLNESIWSMLVPYPSTEFNKWVDKNHLWIVDNPEEKIINYADTGIGYIGSLYETTEFSAKEKEKVYEYVTKTWDKYELDRSIKKKLIRKIKDYPPLYRFTKKIRDAIKK